MAIIQPGVVQGAELKTSESAATEFVADQVLFNLGTIKISQRQAITGALAFLVAWAVKD